MATEVDSLAQVYARSLHGLAEQAGGREKIVEVGEELEQIAELARLDRTFGEFLRSPIIDASARRAAITRIFSDRVTDLTLRFLLVLNQKERLAHLTAITAAYDQMVQEAFGRIEVDVFTPAPLGEEQLAQIRDRVRTALGKDPILYPYSDPSMIGGIKLRIGDQLIDASVATRLRRLRDQLLVGQGLQQQRLQKFIEDARP